MFAGLLMRARSELATEFALLMLLFLVFDYDGSCCYANGAVQSSSL